MRPLPLLFEPFKIGPVEVKNRLVFPPTASVTGTVTERGLAWYDRIARGGVGTIIVEGTRLTLFDSEEFVAGLPRLVNVIHKHGALACIQLFMAPHAGSGEPVSVSGDDAGRALTAEEIRQFIAKFARAARICKDAGFEGVEPHGAHGFLLNQFFSPLTNCRTDEYGGSLEGRMRLGVKIVAGIRAEVPDVLIFYRHTPEQRSEGGYTLQESLKFASKLEEAGVDVLDVSPSTRGVSPQSQESEVGEHAGLAAAFREAVQCPIIAVGGMDDPAAAEDVLRQNKADLVAICRGLIADAEWPKKVAENRLDEIVQCVKCNEKCFGNLRRGVPIACTQWE